MAAYLRLLIQRGQEEMVNSVGLWMRAQKELCCTVLDNRWYGGTQRI